MDSPHLTTMGHKVGEWDADQCARRMGSAAGQPSARRHVRGVWGWRTSCHTFPHIPVTQAASQPILVPGRTWA